MIDRPQGSDPNTFEEQKRIFALNLRGILEERNLEQIEICRALNIPPQTFNSWANGKALPRMDKVQALADYLRVPKSALLDPPGTEPQTLEALLLRRNDLSRLLHAARWLPTNDVNTLTDLAYRLAGENA